MVKTPKKAVLYARVSSDLQKKEKTIESQILELRKQIDHDGNILVKEYLDEGYSGARLDRPAMDELRKDIKTGLFEVIYFLNTDRIAREATYQTIIVGEILKHKKQIIINGKDYVHNPENKFTLTVLGAVSELERAKIIERSMRGKAYKLLHGTYGGGFGIFGYNYVPRTPLARGHFTINEEQAKIVRETFTEYVKADVGLNTLALKFEQKGYTTKMGRKTWNAERLRLLMGNSAYMGKMGFNKTKAITEYSNPMSGITKTTTRFIKRPESERIYLPIPPIVSEELFNKVQEKLQENKKRYYNPNRENLLSGLITCGICKRSFRAIKMHRKRPLTRDLNNIYHLCIYACSWQIKMRKHLMPDGEIYCTNKRVTGTLVEEKLWDIFGLVFSTPEAFKANTVRTAIKESESTQRIAVINSEIKTSLSRKQETLHAYGNGKILQKEYIKLNTELDNKLRLLDFEKAQIIKNKPITPSERTINLAIKRYCESVYLQYLSCTDFDLKREFVVSYVKKIIYTGDTFKVLGVIPIGGSEEKISFEFEGEITTYDRHKKRLLSYKKGFTPYILQKEYPNKENIC